MSFWNNPENNAVKVLLLVVVLAGAGFFVIKSAHPGVDNAPGQVIVAGSAMGGNTLPRLNSNSSGAQSAMTSPGGGTSSLVTVTGGASGGATTGGSTGGGGTTTTGSTSGTFFPSLSVGANPPASLASAIFYAEGRSFFSGVLGVRGQVGVTQNDGTIVATSTPGYNTIYVQGIPVCLMNGSNCPQGTKTGGTTESTGTVTPPSTKVQYSNVGIGTAPSWEPLMVNGQSVFWNDSKADANSFEDPEPGVPVALKATSAAVGTLYSDQEAHFGLNGVYSDPTPGTPAAVKATSISTGKFVVDGEIPVMKINPACFTMHTSWAEVPPLPFSGKDLGKMMLMPGGDLAFGVYVTNAIANLALDIAKDFTKAIGLGGNDWDMKVLISSGVLTTSPVCYNEYGTPYKNSDYGIYGFMLPGKIYPKGNANSH